MMPRGAAREHHALVVEAGHQHPRAPAFLAEHVLVGDLAVVEDQLAGVRAAHAELVELPGGGETPELPLDDERGDAARSGVGVGLGVDHQHVRVGAVGDPHLGPVQHVAVVALLGVQLHRDHVGPRAGLAHRQRADVLAGDEPGEVALALLAGAVPPDLVDAQVRVGAVGEPDRRRRPAHFLDRDDVGEVAHAGAAEVFLDGDSVQPERAELLPQVARELVRRVDLARTRRDLRLCEPVDHVPEGLDLLAEGEAHPGVVHRGVRGSASRA